MTLTLAEENLLAGNLEGLLNRRNRVPVHCGGTYARALPGRLQAKSTLQCVI